MNNNYSKIDHLLLNFPNKEMGPVGSSTHTNNEKKSKENNFSTVKSFIHAHDPGVDKYVKVVPDHPAVTPELEENIGVKPVSNPSFVEQEAIPVDSLISNEGLHILEQVKQNKDPDHNKSWFWRILHRKSMQKSNEQVNTLEKKAA